MISDCRWNGARPDRMARYEHGRISLTRHWQMAFTAAGSQARCCKTLREMDSLCAHCAASQNQGAWNPRCAISHRSDGQAL